MSSADGLAAVSGQALPAGRAPRGGPSPTGRIPTSRGRIGAGCRIGAPAGARPLHGVSGWWSRRSLCTRITTTVGGVAVAALGALAWMATGLIGITVTGAVDVELARAAAVAASHLTAGTAADAGVPAEESAGAVSSQVEIRITDTPERTWSGSPRCSTGARSVWLWPPRWPPSG